MVVTADLRRWEDTATAAGVAVASFLVIVTVDTLGAMRESAWRQGKLADEQRMDQDMEIVEEASTSPARGREGSEPDAQHTEGNGGVEPRGAAQATEMERTGKVPERLCVTGTCKRRHGK